MLSKEDFKKLPVFVTTMSRWDGDVSSASLALSKVLSRTNSLYYIDYPYSLADVWRERKLPNLKKRIKALLFGINYLIKVEKFTNNFFGLTPKAVLPIYSFPAGKVYNLANDFNSKKVARVIQKVIKKNNFKEYIFLNSFNPLYLAEVEKFLNPELSIYHSRDAIEEVPGHGLSRENMCTQHYDLVMATSKQLCRNIGNRNALEVQYFPNGGDVYLFKNAIDKVLEKPDELKNINTKIIGYTGAVCQRIDYELLIRIASEHKDKTIVIVGPRRDKQFTDINLDTISNIVFVSPKTIESLPNYLQYFDCTIIPFKKNNLTGGIYPLKINEYLAAGKSVITTNFSEDINSFKEHVFMAENHEDFVTMIDQAIATNDLKIKQQRFLAAESNSWEKRADLFWDLAYDKYLEKHKYKPQQK